MRTSISTIALAAAGEGGGPSLGEALADADQAARDVAIAAESNAVQAVANVVESAQEQIDEAHDTARRIAEAAMETELGRQIGATNTRVEELWHVVESLKSSLAGQMETLTTIQTQLAATSAVAVVAALDQNSSIQPQSAPETAETKVEEAIGEVATILPGAELAPVENTPAAPVAVKRGKRFL